MAKEPRIKVAVHGYYGFRNVGDEAILSVILQELRREIPNVDPVVISGDPDFTRGLHGVCAVDGRDLEQVAACIRESSLVISGGGGLLQDYWLRDNAEVLAFPAEGGASYAQVPLLAKLYGKPLALLAHGIGPIRTQEGANLVRFIMGMADRITLRDEGSAKLLERLGRTDKVMLVAPDPAFAFPMPPREEARKLLAESIDLSTDPDQTVIAVCVRPWQDESPGWPEGLARALDIFLAEIDGLAVFVPLHEFEHNSDAAQSKSIIDAMSQRDRCVLLREKPPTDVAAILAGCDAVLAMRLHAAIFAVAAGVPVLALAYDPKVREAMRQAGQEDNTLQLHPLDPQDVAARLKTLLDSAPALSAASKGTAASLADQVRLHFVGLADLAQVSAPLPSGLQSVHLPPPTDHYRERLAAEQERSALTQELADLRFQLDDSEGRYREYSRDKEAYIGALLGELRKARALGLMGLLSVIRRVISILVWPARLLLRRLGVTEPTGLKDILRNIVPRRLKLLYREVRRPGQAETHLGRVTMYYERVSPFPTYPLQVSITDQATRQRIDVSLVITVRNEAASARGWFQSLLIQSRLPDELIIVDGGSSDETLQILEEFAQGAPLPVRVIALQDVNIAKGRNAGIGQTSHSVIATTDFGCELDPRWLEFLVSPFELDPRLDVVAGWYESRSRTILGQAAALELAPGLSQIDPASFIPSSRSIAFKKEACDAIGGYPEWLTQTGEDTYFALELKRHSRNWAFAPDAKVYWHAPDSLFSGLKKAYLWAMGDGEAGLFPTRYWETVKASLRYTALLAGGGLLLILSFLLSWWLLLMPSLVVASSVFYLLTRAITGPSWRRRDSRKVTTLTVILWSVIRPLIRMARALGFLRGVGNRPASLARRSASIRGVAFLLSGVPISDSGGGQRAAQLALTLLREDYLVVFINRFPSYENVDLNLEVNHPCLFTYSWSTFDFSAFQARYRSLADRPLMAIVEFPLAEFAALATEIRQAGGKVIYDCLDDWTTSLGGSWYSLETEKRLIATSDALVATAQPLKQRLEEISGRPVTLVPNAVNTDVFRRDAAYPRPLDLIGGEFVICYIGALWGEWFNWDLLRKVALAYPRAGVVVIGDYRGQCPDPPRNLRFLGLKPQRDLPAYLAHVDVTIIPWSVSRLTQATNPLKVYEYLAMGKPVVAPRIKGLDGIPHVLLADSDEEFIANIGQARTIEIDDSVIGAFIQENSWPQRVSTLMRLVADSGTAQLEGSRVESPSSLPQ